MTVRGLVASITSVLIAASCAPGLPEGRFACSEAVPCPSSWFCHSDSLCYSRPEPDAAVDSGDDAATEASSCAPDDLPDDAFLDSNCDGIDGVAASMIFVSVTTGADASPGDGSREHPFASIERGIAEAVSTSKSSVAVMAGTYAERVVVRDGISIYGGYGAGWSRSANDAVVITQPITPFTDDEGSRIECVLAANIHTPTVLDRMTILAGSTTDVPTMPNISVYGIRIIDSVATSSTGLVLRNLDVTAGRASDGTTGTPGSRGEPAVQGQYGDFGGAGGVAVCGGVRIPETGGGHGGYGAIDYVRGCGGLSDATNGAGPYGSWCGIAIKGTNYDGCVMWSSLVTDFSHNGRSTPFHNCGADLSSARGSPALPLLAVGRVVGRQFVAERGATGGRGAHGSGGPGGGGGGGADYTSGFGSPGGDGAGGNSGSCGGYPGMGGTGGGSSIGVLVIRSTNVRIEASTFTTSSAGTGGAGGPGGAAGNANIPFPDGGARGLSVSTGGSGGGGRVGAAGGGGGGGAGGSSIAQLICSSTGVFTSTGTPGAAGSGGVGANASPSGPNGRSSAYETSCALAPDL